MAITYNGQLVLAIIASAFWLFSVIAFAPGKDDNAGKEIPVQMPLVLEGILHSRPMDRPHERMQEQTEVIWHERKRP